MLNNKNISLCLCLVNILQIHIKPARELIKLSSQKKWFLFIFNSDARKGKVSIIFWRDLATDSVEDVISGIDPSRGASPPPSFAMNSWKVRKHNYITGIDAHHQTKNENYMLSFPKWYAYLWQDESKPYPNLPRKF